jgi:hypothetical protein
MQQPKIELAKTRDLGEIISDSFTFIRQNFKPLFKTVFTFCGLLILASAATFTLQQLKVLDLQKHIFENRFETFSTMSDRFGIEYALSMLFMLLSYTLMSTTVLSYMAIYKQKGNIAPTTEEVWGYVKYYFFRILLGNVLLTPLLLIATALCFAPGIYVYPIFGLIYPIMVIENASFGYAFNRSFKLINNNWWSTFGALIIMVLIMYVAWMIFSIPNTIITVLSALTHGRVSSSPVFTVIGSVLQQLGQVLYVLPIVTLVMCYFNLTEIKEGSGLIDRINQFGSNSTDNQLPAEEY